jgi:hypothetical protein
MKCNLLSERMQHSTVISVLKWGKKARVSVSVREQHIIGMSAANMDVWGGRGEGGSGWWKG